MLFDATHISYMVISAALTVILLVLASKFAKSGDKKSIVLKTAAVVTIILHYSSIWVEYFSNGGSTDGLEGSHLLPIYPCHIIMWLLFITAFFKNKESGWFTLFAEFCFWGGIICGSIGILLNENYSSTPSLYDWEVFKGLVSHSTMIFGCIYLLVGGYIKIRVFNVVSVAVGLCFFIFEGAFVNALYTLCELDSVNAMYLQESPIPSMPWLSPILMGMVGVSLLFVGLAIYEYRCFPVEERWYTKLKYYKDELLNSKRGE